MSLELENMTPYKIYKQKNVKTLIKVGVPFQKGYNIEEKPFMFLGTRNITNYLVNLLILTENGIEEIEKMPKSDYSNFFQKVEYDAL